MRRVVTIAVLAAVLLCGMCSSALADGDPASDYLLRQQVFVLLQAGGMPPAQRELSNLVADANKAGFPIRVAVISSEYDLGSVSVLWRKPQTYARFLGIELSLSYKGLLLVVMPNGFGVNWPGHSTSAAYRALASIRVPAGEIGTIAAAQAAVHGLLSAGGVDLASGAKTARSGSAAGTGHSSHGASSGSSGVSASTVLLIVAAVMIAIAFAAALLERRRGARPAPADDAPTEDDGAPKPAAPSPSRAFDFSFKWALPSMAALFAVAVAVAVAAVGLLRRERSHRSSQRTAQTITQETPFTWGEGQRRAPDFALTDQNGQVISPAAYRGRPIIITFIDPLCRNLCPLEARVLNEADEKLPVSQRPEIIAVSVDVYADTRTDLVLDFDRWSLVPQWEWAVGTHAQLQVVWKRYYAEVEVQTKHIAGTTVHYITHSEMAYIVDAKGYERALFSWPFSAKAVGKALLQIEHA